MVAPANDNFANATSITLTGGEFTSGVVDSVEATTEPGEPGAGARSVWWSIVPATSGSLTFDTRQTTIAAGGFIDTTLGIYTGTAVGSLTQLAENDDIGGGVYTSEITLDVTAGTTYYVRVATWANDATSDRYVLHVAAPPPNGTDLTFDNDGYDYTGSAEVDDDPAVDLPPVHAREDIDRVHQSLPAPTLVDGRPT